MTVWHNPVAAYDRIAPIFPDLVEQRLAYLNAVESLVANEIPRGSRSMLDVGAGDGSRARRIAQATGISGVTLVEPAAGMRGEGSADAQLLTMRAEDLHEIETRFDVVLCLWNVLGHIFPSAARVEVLRQFARLLTPQGKAFIDVNHRYNARHYGSLPTAMRFIRDKLYWCETNGDVAVRWDFEGGQCGTQGHVFTHKEVQSLCNCAGLGIERKFVVDYATGQLCRRDFEGHLLYVLRPAIAS